MVGALIFRGTPELRREGMPFGLAFSLEALLPGAKLRERHSHIDFDGWQRYWLYAHKAAGFVLGSFLVAGLAGLTK